MLEPACIFTFKGDELKEVAGSVFVDGSLEFCAPEVRIIINKDKNDYKNPQKGKHNLRIELKTNKFIHFVYFSLA